jgi:sucrose phosphorylase
MNTREMVQKLYPDHVDQVEAGIESLLSKYDFGSPQRQRLTQRDAIMITYGDAFRDDRGNPLDCLRRFACEQLGDAISAIHLLPCFPYTSDDGFSVQDYFRIDPELGNWNDIEQLGESYELMFDAVVNHISQASDWFQGFLAGAAEYDDFFIVAEPDADYASVTRPRALPLLHPYQRSGETVNVWTTFSADQVDLNFRSHRVFLKILDVLLFYVSRGARYIRLDAIAFIWKERGTTCMHLPQTHAIIQLYRQVLERVAPQVVIITETNVPHEENVSYFGNGHNEAHMVYNFTLPPLLMYSLHKQDISVLTDWARGLTLPSDEVCFFNFTASHDGVGVRPLQRILSDQEVEWLAEIARRHGGFVSMRDNGDGTQSPYEINCNYLDFATPPDADSELRADRFLLTQSVMLAMPGVPGIYYHSLIGSENDRQAALDSGINRRINRAKVDYGTLRDQLGDVESLRGKVFSRYKRLLEIRQQQPAFDPFAAATFQARGPVFVITRGSPDQPVVTLHNFSEQTIEISDLGELSTDLISGEPIQSSPITVKPFEFRWLK